MIDDFRREGRYLGGFEDIAPLIEERRDFFKQKVDSDLAIRALDLIGGWCDSEDEGERLRDGGLRRRFVDGMTREQIGDALNERVQGR